MSANQFANMIGRRMTQVEGAVGDDAMRFHAYDGAVFTFYHSQDCCESVSIAEIVGDIADLIGTPLVEAEEVSIEGAEAPESADSYTWTFYKFATAKGSVTVRWLGQSNGYYSESVCFQEKLPAVVS